MIKLFDSHTHLNNDTFSDEERDSKIEEIFGTYENACKEKSLIRPVQMEKATNAQEVQKIYDKWVCTEKAEGIVVHSEFPFIWKTKPQLPLLNTAS